MESFHIPSTQRMHEIGIRLALGASPFDVIKLVVGHGMMLALAGIFIGLVGVVAADSIARRAWFMK